MKKRLTSNLSLKLISLFAAIFVWIIVVNIDDPYSMKSYSNIPVEIMNENVITKEGKIYTILENSNVISISVYARRSVHDKLSSADFKATADMKELSFMDTVPILVEPLRFKDKIGSDDITYKTKNLKVSIDDLSSQQFSIDTAVIGKPATGYAIGNGSLSQSTVTISGPASVVNTINKVIAEVSVEGMRQDVVTPVNLKVYDGNHKQMDTSKLQLSAVSVTATVKMLVTKNIQLNFEIQGIPADGYRVLGNVVCEPSTIEIAGTEDQLSAVNSINIPASELDLTGLTGNLEKTINISKYISRGIKLISDPEVLVSVYVEQLHIKEIEIPALSITVNNLAEGYGASFVSYENVKLSVRGLAEELADFNIAQIAASIDLTGLEKGTYQVPIQLQLPEGFESMEQKTIEVKLEDLKDSSNENKSSDSEDQNE